MSNRTFRTTRLLTSLALVGATTSACVVDTTKSLSEITAPVSVSYPHDVRLSSKSTSGGALMFDVTGATVDSVSSAIGSAFMIESDGAACGTRVVYTGSWRDESIATLWVHAADTPTLTVRQAAREITHTNVDLPEVALTVRKR